MISLAAGRGRAEWGRTATLAALIHRTFTGEAIDPNDLVPGQYRDGGPKPAAKGVADKTPGEVAAESAAMKALMLRHTLRA